MINYPTVTYTDYAYEIRGDDHYRTVDIWWLIGREKSQKTLKRQIAKAIRKVKEQDELSARHRKLAKELGQNA